MTGATATCRRCSAPLARADAWYCDDHRTPSRGQRKAPIVREVHPTSYVDPLASRGHAEPTETDIARVLELADRFGVPVYSPDRHGNLTRRTKENPA